MSFHAIFMCRKLDWNIQTCYILSMIQRKISNVSKEIVTSMYIWKEELYITKAKVVPNAVLEFLGFYGWFLWLKHLWHRKNCLMNVLPSNTPQGILHSLPIMAFVSTDNSTSWLLRKQNSYWSCMFMRRSWSWSGFSDSDLAGYFTHNYTPMRIDDCWDFFWFAYYTW